MQVGQPVTQRSLEIVKIEHKLEKRPGITGAWDEKDDDGAPVRNEYKKAPCTPPGCQSQCKTFFM